MTGVFDIFSIGIGPSSSHTVGPMKAAAQLVGELAAIDDARERGLPTPDFPQVAPPPPDASDRPANLIAQPIGLRQVDAIRIELLGSLGATGLGHGSDRAVLAGLMGARPDTVSPAAIDAAMSELKATHQLVLLGGEPMRQHVIEGFNPEQSVTLRPNKRLPFHPNAIRFHLHGANSWRQVTYYSPGGGFVVRDDGTGQPMPSSETPASPVPRPFSTGQELLDHCLANGLSVAQVMMADEVARGRTATEVNEGLGDIWAVMNQSIETGCSPASLPGTAGQNASDTLPGGLGVRRRAPQLLQQLLAQGAGSDSLAGLDWVSLWALAVGEVNAAGGRVVTAPTNGAAGIVPAVLRYAMTLHTTGQRYGNQTEAAADFLLAAGAIGAIYQGGASISGAEVGCQGEIGVACSMAAAGLVQVLGGTPQQTLNAAEIGLEHHLGLTCDPVGGLVQVPCIERNAVGASTAITAARLALVGDGRQVVSLDQVIASMMEIGADMSTKYKETGRGGLALACVAC